MDRLEATLAALPARYAGPGGAVAVLREGEVIHRHAWGYANAERRIPFTPATLFRMCSITKQFTVALVIEMFGDPRLLDADIRARLPGLAQAPGALHLCHNQSGLRDYWALAMLHGAGAEDPFGDAEAHLVIDGARSLMFAPGTAFSYCNQNFRLLSDIVQDRAGQPFATLLRERILGPAGMASAFLAADTRAMPDGTEGYEGSVATGFHPAVNRIQWTGDAGLGASLDDMIALERLLDASRDDPWSLPGRLAAPVAFADGTPAGYGFGLGRRTERGQAVIGHGGALRGWRSHRLTVPSERLSVVVLFNHMADAHAAALDVMEAALGTAAPEPPEAVPEPSWTGAYLDPTTGLSARVAHQGAQVRLHYGQTPELLELQPDGSAGPAGTRLVPSGGGLRMHRPFENRTIELQRLPPPGTEPFDGTFVCDELEAALTVEVAGGVPYGALSGRLGRGRMEMLSPIGADVWALPCPRALDVAPPGDWTLVARRDAAGQVDTLRVGCWLARDLVYRRF